MGAASAVPLCGEHDVPARPVGGVHTVEIVHRAVTIGDHVNLTADSKTAGLGIAAAGDANEEIPVGLEDRILGFFRLARMIRTKRRQEAVAIDVHLDPGRLDLIHFDLHGDLPQVALTYAG